MNVNYSMISLPRAGGKTTMLVNAVCKFAEENRHSKILVWSLSFTQSHRIKTMIWKHFGWRVTNLNTFRMDLLGQRRIDFAMNTSNVHGLKYDMVVIDDVEYLDKPETLHALVNLNGGTILQSKTVNHD